MCGIAGFIADRIAEEDSTQLLEPFERITEMLSIAAGSDDPIAGALEAVEKLSESFDALMSFALHRAAACDSGATKTLEALAEALERLEEKATSINTQREIEEVDAALLAFGDYAWQVRKEALNCVGRVARLLPTPIEKTPITSHFVAWGVERVLGSIDKLEVRGRDSLGISICFKLDDGAPVLTDEETQADEASARQVGIYKTEKGETVFRAIYKTCGLVGRLGDNGAAIRKMIGEDPLFWRMAEKATGLNALAHTRWASNGIINIANCHPVGGRLERVEAGDPPESNKTFHATAAINGDIDNYPSLKRDAVQALGLAIPHAVSTDAKIVPVMAALETRATQSTLDRLAETLNRCHGSLAVAMQDPTLPNQLALAQKGSGQALYIGETKDGWMIASEVYGLCVECRSYRQMNTVGKIGVGMSLSVTQGKKMLAGRRLAEKSPWSPEEESIEIYARDIYRGDYAYYIEKEIGEAPDIIRKTLHRKYEKGAKTVRFLEEGIGNGRLLRKRLDAGDEPAIRRIIAIGQGTAAAAAMGISYLIGRALSGSGITVEHATASELFGFDQTVRFDDALIIAISQSGTTTDTNRVVDLARSRGAWIHAIVNRRNASLVRKAHSYLYTGSGRDVEMSVASTKAYYSQIAAGQLIALYLANHMNTMPQEMLFERIEALESLPDRIEKVLAQREKLDEVASRYYTGSPNWAVVGNGPNRIAAEEIRIKLSELCYKAIPCDVTEDKKHIDLSTEPLTLVIANDLPEAVVQDTVKETAIFKAHNGHPIVLVSEGENRFDETADVVFPLPRIGAGLDFVVATVAGHLLGIAAAKAIDASAEPFREARAVLGEMYTLPEKWNRAALIDRFSKAWETLENGAADASLSARRVARLGKYLRGLDALPENAKAEDANLEEGLKIVNDLVEEMTRPIDTIRHQAKTVTVGISRPQREISPLVHQGLHALGVTIDSLGPNDVEMLEALSPILADITGALHYRVTRIEIGPDGDPIWRIRADKAHGHTQIQASRYYEKEGRAVGGKRRLLRKGRGVCHAGPKEEQNLIVMPVFNRKGGAIAGIAQLEVTITSRASLQQKREILMTFNEKYQDLIDRLGEMDQDDKMDDLLQALPLRDLIFKPISHVIDAWTGDLPGSSS